MPVATPTTTVAVSTAAAPITLQTAATAARSIGGKLTLPASFADTAFVTAQQTFAAAPKVTLKYQGVDPVVGTYTLANLPTTAPQYAAYSATLPLVFAARTDTVPGTAKYAVEATATGIGSKIVSPVDLAAADVANVNFTFP